MNSVTSDKRFLQFKLGLRILSKTDQQNQSKILVFGTVTIFVFGLVQFDFEN